MTTTTDTTRILFICPHCNRRVSTSDDHAGKHGRCPRCQGIMIVPERPTPPADKVDRSAIDITTASITDMLADRQKREQIFLTALKLTAAAVGFVVIVVLLYGFTINAAAIGNNVAMVVGELLGICILFGPYFGPATFYYALAVHKVRALRNIIYYGLWLSFPFFFVYSIVLGLVIQNMDWLGVGLLGGAFFGTPWFCVGHWPARWITPYVVALLVHRLVCPHCREELELRSRWACSCGYTDHRDDRNILLFSCPKCGERVGCVDCLRCEATILI